MGLLAPWFLAGLAAIGLPVWLHLLKKHRASPLPFASLMFFEPHTQSSVKHRRLRYLLLFALRTAFLFLLALLFSRPFTMRPGAVAAGSQLVVLAIDNSFSMRQGNRLERAKTEAERVPGARKQVLAFAAQVREYPEIRAIQPTDERGSFVELARALRAIAARIPVEAHVFSDMQRTSLPSNFTDMALGDGVTLVLHPIGAAAGNYAVESVKSPRYVYGDGHVRVEATIAGYGTEPAARRAILTVNGRQVETQNLEIPAAGRATVAFSPFESAHGANRCDVRIEPADAFPNDDRFWFAVDRAEAMPVLFVQETPDSRALLYVRAALESAAGSAFRLEPATVAQAPDPARYGLVILSDAAPSTAFETALKDYVRRGGCLLIALGRNARRRVPVLDAPITGLNTTPQSGFSQARFYQTVRVEPGDARVTARLADGTPLILETGRVIVFTSTFDNLANDFPLHAGFVPFISETARRLGGLDRAPAANTVGPRFATAGFHEIRRELFAVNPDRRESDLATIPPETLALWRNTGRGGTRTIQSEPRRVEFWWYLALAAVALALAESIIGNLHLGGAGFSPRGASAPQERQGATP